MKKIKFFLIAACIATLTSCDYEPKVYDNVNGKTLASFSSLTYDLPIVIDATGSSDITVNTSTVSDVDRTFNIEVDMDNTTAIMGSYNVPTSVTIPAGEYSGTLTLTGTDVAGVDTTPEVLALNLVGGDGFGVGPTALVSVFQVCPIPATFMVGDYLLGDISGVVGPGNGTSNFESIQVTIAVGATESQRVFRSAIYPGFRPTQVDVLVNLSCGELILANVGPSPGLGCTATDIRFDAASTASTYDLTDDTFIIVNYNEDVDDSCGGPFADQAFFLQKI